MTVSGLLFALFEADTSNATLVVGYVLFGVGFGLVNAPITNTAVSGMPTDQAGVASAVASTSRQLGQTLGVAVLGAVLAAGVGASSYADTFVTASRPGWWILAACGAVVLVLGALTTGPWARGDSGAGGGPSCDGGAAPGGGGGLRPARDDSRSRALHPRLAQFPAPLGVRRAPGHFRALCPVLPSRAVPRAPGCPAARVFPGRAS
ncbi:hypothetical protein SALBM217S_00023 [Streptomyces griseoloalbus]